MIIRPKNAETVTLLATDVDALPLLVVHTAILLLTIDIFIMTGTVNLSQVITKAIQLLRLPAPADVSIVIHLATAISAAYTLLWTIPTILVLQFSDVSPVPMTAKIAIKMADAHPAIPPTLELSTTPHLGVNLLQDTLIQVLLLLNSA